MYVPSYLDPSHDYVFEREPTTDTPCICLRQANPFCLPIRHHSTITHLLSTVHPPSKLSHTSTQSNTSIPHPTMKSSTVPLPLLLLLLLLLLCHVSDNVNALALQNPLTPGRRSTKAASDTQQWIANGLAQQATTPIVQGPAHVLMYDTTLRGEFRDMRRRV